MFHRVTVSVSSCIRTMWMQNSLSSFNCTSHDPQQIKPFFLSQWNYLMRKRLWPLNCPQILQRRQQIFEEFESKQQFFCFLLNTSERHTVPGVLSHTAVRTTFNVLYKYNIIKDSVIGMCIILIALILKPAGQRHKDWIRKLQFIAKWRLFEDADSQPILWKQWFYISGLSGTSSSHVCCLLPEQTKVRTHCLRVHWDLLWGERTVSTCVPTTNK